jgi:hypothetical protein
MTMVTALKVPVGPCRSGGVVARSSDGVVLLEKLHHTVEHTVRLNENFRRSEDNRASNGRL